jgi:NADP-dependent 3-hydroxy acid dehydrogenase YdfG
METLRGSVALVTGAGGGIGRAIACALVGAGSEAWLVGRTPTKLEETAQTCGREHVRVRPLDLTNTDAMEELVRELDREAEQLDVLVHCVGVIALGRIAEAPAQSLDDQYATNVRVFYTLSQQLLPLLRRGPGQVVVVNSSVVLAPRAGAGQYAATQHALRALTDTLRQEVNTDGIRVLSVFPGRTATTLQENLYAAEQKPYRPELLLQPKDVAAMVLASLTLPPTAEVTDIHIRPMLKSY